MTARFERYVAIGDSSTEGLDDPDGAGGYRGWADRLAARLAASQGGIRYANFGVRGLRTAEVRARQLAPALALAPDLASVFCGTNDVIARAFDPEGVAADVEHMQRAFVSRGASVVTFTLPDLTPVMPLARLLAGRVARLNDALRRAADRSGARLVDFARVEVATDPRLWSEDRIHANAAGHARIAHALAHALALPGADASWREPLRPASAPGVLARARAEARWMRRHLLPWLAGAGRTRVPRRGKCETLREIGATAGSAHAETDRDPGRDLRG